MAHQTSATIALGGNVRLLAALIAMALLAAVLPRGVEAGTGDPVLLNEALVSHTGADTTEYFELYGTPGTPLAGLSLIVVEGDGAAAGTLDFRVDLTGDARLGGNGFYLLGGAAGLNENYDVTPNMAFPGLKTSDWIENGSETLALAETATLGDVGSHLTGSETVVDAVGLTDDGPTDQWFWSTPVVGPDDGFLPGGARRFTDGVDTNAVSDWVFADDLLGPTNTPTPATPYNAPPTAECGPGLVTTEGTATLAGVSGTDPDGRMVSFSVTSAPDPGSVSVSGVVVAPGVGQRATAQVDVTASTPPGSYAVTVTATNNDPAPQSAECQLSVTVNKDPTPEPPPPDPGPALDTAALWSLVQQAVVNDGMAAAKARTC
jgi:hypothetical protein